jgi:signal transduction histidine kinase
MRLLGIAALLAAAAWMGRAQEPEANVNEKSTVESVGLSGAVEYKLEKPVREELRRLVGQNFSQQRLEELKKLIHKAFPDRPISIQVSRGSTPDHVKVTFALGGRSKRLDLTAPRGVYQAHQGWSCELDGTAQAHWAVLSLGAVSDGDSLLERFTGIKLRVEDQKAGAGRVRLAPGNPAALADEDLLKGILTNLLENAADAAGAGGSVLARASVANRQVSIEVHDSGPGLSEEARRSLFEPTISFEEGGMGLGLSITRKNVLPSGGDILPIAGELGGPAFRVVLPEAGHGPSARAFDGGTYGRIMVSLFR